jgi:hypothetical protein
MIRQIVRLGCFAVAAALFTSSVAMAQPYNGWTSLPRVTNGFPNSSLTITNPNTNPGTIVIDDRNFGTGSGVNMHMVQASKDNGATGYTHSITEGFRIEADVTLADGTNAPRKEAGFRVIGNPTGEALFIINSDAGEIVAFGGGAPFKLFGNNAGGNGYTPGTTIHMGMQYLPVGLSGQPKGTLEYFITRPGGSPETSGPLLWDNTEGGPTNFQVAAYVQGAPADANDFMTATFGNLTITPIVPEPASIGVLSVAGASLLARRRRRVA